jgi:pyruvate dehydrogenase E1 component alpha subunit
MSTTAPLSGDRLLALVRQMMLIRRFDELALELVQSSRIDGVVHSSLGQEACAVGVCAALRVSDRVISNHRGHAHCIAKGTPVTAMMAELFGKETGCCRGRGGSMHIADVSVGMLGANGIVGAGLPMALGAAWSDLLDGSDTVTTVFFGDGATGQGILYECMNIAVLHRLPVLFVCENNSIAGLTPLQAILATPNVAGLATGHGLRAVTIDGSDLGATYAAANDATRRLRAGEGPELIECVVDRWSVHASRRVPFPETRDQATVELARMKDPIKRAVSLLETSSELDGSRLPTIEAEIDDEIQAALHYAEISPPPDPSSALAGVFA